MFCSSKFLCLTPNQGSLVEEDFSFININKGKRRTQCKMCQRKGIKVPPFDFKECSRKENCINPNQGNLTKDDFNKRSGEICLMCRRKSDNDYNKIG